MTSKATLKKRLKRIYAMDQATLSQALLDERTALEAQLDRIAREKHPPIVTPAHFFEKEDEPTDLPDAYSPIGHVCDHCEQPRYPLYLYTVLLKNGTDRNYWVCADCRPAYEQDEPKD